MPSGVAYFYTYVRCKPGEVGIADNDFFLPISATRPDGSRFEAEIHVLKGMTGVAIAAGIAAALKGGGLTVQYTDGQRSVQVTEVVEVDIGTQCGNFRGTAWPAPIPDGSEGPNTSVPVKVTLYTTPDAMDDEVKRRRDQRRAKAAGGAK